MEARTCQFSDRIQYFFDGAQENSELDAGSALTLELYGDETKIAKIIEASGPETVEHHYKNRRGKCLRLAAMADTIIQQLPENRRAGLVRHGLTYVGHAVYDLAETMSYWTIEDEIDGGCMEPYRRHPRSRNGVTFKHTVRRLRSPKFIRRYVKVNAAEHADHLMDLNRIVVARAKITPPRADPDLMQLYRAQLAAMQPRHDRMIKTAFPHLYNRLELPTPRDQRKVIKRSMAVATSLLGEETVRAFLRGEQIRLVGTDAMLVLRKRGRLAARGHGCLSVAIADREGTTLADLCTYIDDTPTLDQLCGFALWMNAGEERKIMETANITKLADGAREHPIIAHHYANRREVPAEYVVDERAVYHHGTGQIVHRYQLTHAEKQERARVYFENTKHEWVHALLVAVIGYRNFPFYKSAGSIS